MAVDWAAVSWDQVPTAKSAAPRGRSFTRCATPPVWAAITWMVPWVISRAHTRAPRQLMTTHVHLQVQRLGTYQVHLSRLHTSRITMAPSLLTHHHKNSATVRHRRHPRGIKPIRHLPPLIHIGPKTPILHRGLILRHSKDTTTRIRRSPIATIPSRHRHPSRPTVDTMKGSLSIRRRAPDITNSWVCGVDS